MMSALDAGADGTPDASMGVPPSGEECCSKGRSRALPSVITGASPAIAARSVRGIRATAKPAEVSHEYRRLI